MNGRARTLLGLVACVSCGTEPNPPTTWARDVFGEPNVLWYVDSDAGGGAMTPVFDADRAYFLQRELIRNNTFISVPRAIAVRRTDGHVDWSQALTLASEVSAAVSGQTVGYALSVGFIAFDRATGAVKYTVHVPTTTTQFTGDLVSDDTHFYLNSNGGRIQWVTTATGDVPIDRGIGTSTAARGLALAGSSILAAGRSGQLGLFPITSQDSLVVTALDRTTGDSRWRIARDLGTRAVDPPVIVGDNVIVKSSANTVFAFALADGALRWTRSLDTSPIVLLGVGGLAACDGKVFAATGDGGVAAIDPGTGTILWRVSNLSFGVDNKLSCGFGTVLFGNLLVLDASTGAQRARYPKPGVDPDDFFILGTARDETSLYIATTKGFVRIKAP